MGLVSLGEMVKNLRNRKGMTQPELASCLGIEQSYLSKLENGKNLFNSHIFKEVSNVLGVDFLHLLKDVSLESLNTHKDIPEVSIYLSTLKKKNTYKNKKVLLSSFFLFIVGFNSALLAHLEILYSNTVYSYVSEGVIKDGEPTDIFKSYKNILTNKFIAEDITLEKMNQMQAEFRLRVQEKFILRRTYAGESFISNEKSGQRKYILETTTSNKAIENSLLIWVGLSLILASSFLFLSLKYSFKKLINSN